MSYDRWKTRSPDDELYGDPPEVWEDCPNCSGEGGYEKHCMTYELGCGFAHDDSYWVECETCNGTGGMICEAVGDWA